MFFKTITQKKTRRKPESAALDGVRRPERARQNTVGTVSIGPFHMVSYGCKELSAAGPAAVVIN
jgi:hypothetical protein